MQDAVENAKARVDADRRSAAWEAGAEARERQADINRRGAAAARAALGIPQQSSPEGGLSPAAREAIADSRARSASRHQALEQIARIAPDRSYHAPIQKPVNREPWPDDRLDAAS